MKTQILTFAAGALLLAAQAAEPRFSGPAVKDSADLAPYTGIDAADRIEGDWRKKAYVANFEQLAVNYGNNVDFQLREKQILLTPETEEFLYTKLIPKLRYQKGSRPALEAVVANATKGCRTTQDKALALMRFCRDLKKKKDKAPWCYGGTEEELIAKGEDLCETLGRLYVALCEIAGIPARIIMHDIGGHITAEAYIDGSWGYVDPRFGVYFLKQDGKLASLRELMRDPDITRNQVDAVKRDIGGNYTWEERAARCRDKFFRPEEVNGFEYYSLGDAGLYRYGTLDARASDANGLVQAGEVYGALIRQVFIGNPEIEDYFWTPGPLKKLPITWRNDGFTPWWELKPPVEEEVLDKKMFAPMAKAPFAIMVFGTGPGSTFTHRTKVGEIYGYEITDSEWKEIMTPGDRYVHDGIVDLIERGIDPQELVVKLAHKYGFKLYSRLEMNHEYTPQSKWLWKGFVGEFNKKHPEYRISSGNANLDYSHPEVRAFKLAVLRELAQAGIDGLEVDLAVYAPHFAKPDAKIMTDFIRDVRKMLDEEGKKQGKRIELEVVVPNRTGSDPLPEYGIDWREWIKAKLADRIIPGTAVNGSRGRYALDHRVGKYVRAAKGSGTAIFGYLDQSLRIHNRDEMPDGIRRYSRGKHLEEFRAQALVYMRTGVDGLHLAMASNGQYKPGRYDDLGTPEKIEFADKNYIAGPFDDLPVIDPAKSGKKGFFTMTQIQRLRIADDIRAAAAKGICPRAVAVLNNRALRPGETIEVFINGHSAGSFSGDDPEEKKRLDVGPIVPTEADLQVPDWWKRGVHALGFPAENLWLGENIIRIVYSTTTPESAPPIQFMWPEIQLRYPKAK